MSCMVVSVLCFPIKNVHFVTWFGDDQLNMRYLGIVVYSYSPIDIITVARGAYIYLSKYNILYLSYENSILI